MKSLSYFRFKLKFPVLLLVQIVLVYADGQKTSDNLIVNHGPNQPLAPYDITITGNRPMVIRPVTSISGITYRYQDEDRELLESFGETGHATRVQSRPVAVVSSTHRGGQPTRLTVDQYVTGIRHPGSVVIDESHRHYATGYRNGTHHRHGDYPRDHIINVNEVETLSRGTFHGDHHHHQGTDHHRIGHVHHSGGHHHSINHTASGGTHRTYDGPGIVGPHHRLVEHRQGHNGSRIFTTHGTRVDTALIPGGGSGGSIESSYNNRGTLVTGGGGTAVESHSRGAPVAGGSTVVYGLRPDSVIGHHRDDQGTSSSGASRVVSGSHGGASGGLEIESLSRGAVVTGSSTGSRHGDETVSHSGERVGVSSSTGRDQARYGTSYAVDSSSSGRLQAGSAATGAHQGPTLINRIQTGGGGGNQDRVGVTSIGRQGTGTYVVDSSGDRIDSASDSGTIRGGSTQGVTRIQGGSGSVVSIGTRPETTRIQDGATQGITRIQTPGSTGTAHHIDVADRVDVETFNRTSSNATSGQLIRPALTNAEIEEENRARIFAEQKNEEEAKKHAQNVVRLAATDQLNSEIITNRTRAYLSCESGEMIVKINFTEPFRGIGYADYDRTSPCKFYGDGGTYYEMRLPLKGCGTKQEAPRIFLNNIIIRFHRSLELEEDEIKTIICRYPPPLAPPPPLIAAPILEQPPPIAPFMPAKLSEVELLLIVSALLFLTLLLLGIGIGYYCLKKRKVNVVRKFVPPEIPYFPPPSISSEERSIISETSIIHRDDYQYQNMGYLPEAKHGFLDDLYYHDENLIDEDVLQQQQNVIVPPVPVYSTKKIDDRFVTQVSETDGETDQEIGRVIVPKKPKITKLITDDYFVTPKTTTEVIDEITTHRVIVPPEKPLTIKRVDDTMITPLVETVVDDEETRHRIFGPSKISTQQVDDLYVHSESETDLVDDVTRHRIVHPTGPGKKPPTKKVDTLEKDDYYRTDMYEIDEIIDDHETRVFQQPPPPGPTTTTVTTTTKIDDETMVTREIDEFLDDTRHRAPTKKPKITVQNIDDFYVTNITETETNEQTTKIGRSMPNLTLNVDYEDYEQEETTMLTGFDVKMRTIPRKPPREPPTTTTTTTTYTSETSTTKIDEVLRILDNPPREKLPDLDDHFMLPTRNRLRQIILTDETFRTLVIESTTVEEYYEKIQRHPSYGPMFEPPTWNVIFRLLSLPEVTDASKRRPTKKGRYSDTFRSGMSAQEVRSVTEEDVTFSRRITSTGAQRRVPLPDYPMDDDDDLGRRPDSKKPSGPHWASYLPDPRPYDARRSPDRPAITPAFATTRRRYPDYSATTSTLPPSSSSVFGSRRLENPYEVSPSPATRRRLFDYDLRPYSPDLDALSLEPSQSYLNYSGSIRRSRQQHQAISEEREEIKSTTETNVYDWKRYG